MKALPITILIFLIMISVIIINVGFINRTSRTMHSLLDNLDESSEREVGISELECFWKNNQSIVGLSISNTQLDNISSLVICLRCSYEEKDDTEFERYRALLYDAADNIRRFEKFSLNNVF